MKGFLLCVAVGGYDMATGKVRYHTKAYPDEATRPFLRPHIYIPMCDIISITKYQNLAEHNKDRNSVFKGFSKWGDETTKYCRFFTDMKTSPLVFNCTCDFRAGDSNDCTCGASVAILPLYQITVKNHGLHQMDDNFDDDASVYTPELVTYLVHPQERERMALLIAGHDPMVDLVNELRYNPTSGRLMEAAREDFESATKRARVL